MSRIVRHTTHVNKKLWLGNVVIPMEEYCQVLTKEMTATYHRPNNRLFEAYQACGFSWSNNRGYSRVHLSEAVDFLRIATYDHGRCTISSE